jgi:hypothetical protein
MWPRRHAQRASVNRVDPIVADACLHPPNGGVVARIGARAF